MSRCTGCQACSIACKDRADLPDALDWLRVEAHEQGTYPEVAFAYRVVHCFHCAAPPCAAVCPTAAMAQGEDGWVQIDGELCIACGACVEACPFAAIVMGSEGTASKCDGCADEVAQGWDPTCVRACPMRALQFGSVGDAWPEGRVADPTFEDHGIRPAVRYLRRSECDS
jgi:anaerobic dimethyl sulfoxide reductase subunit B (iron-sulfur subunit)